MTQSPTPTFNRLSELDTASLDTEFLRGTTPSAEDLAGWEHRGLNIAKSTKLLGIRQFIKGFYKDGADLRGYNVKVRQGTDWETDVPPVRHGFYLVEPVRADALDNKYLHAVLLDYGRGDNPRMDPSRGLRDYLVAVDDGTYLGKAYYAVGAARIPLPSYFVLDRLHRA